MTQDDTRAKFLVALREARAQKKVNLTEFEGGFVEDCYDQFNYSPRQRNAIDKMRHKYAAAIGFHDSGSKLAAEAKKEEERVRDAAMGTQRVVVGGKLKIEKAKSLATVATYRRPS